MNENTQFNNYCACFLDLLGQKEVLHGQSIIPDKDNIDAYKKFVESANKSIGAIDKLQKHANLLMKNNEGNSSLQEQLSPEDVLLYEEMKSAKPKKQRWSDGLVLYNSLAADKFKCPMNAVIEIFILSGTLCLLGLANRTPVRGAIEVSWGVELHENELYGAIVANSYILESTIAKYPRIVIGMNTMQYLHTCLQEAIKFDDNTSMYNRVLASHCLKFTTIDKDGYYIIDYLGAHFKSSILANEEGRNLYEISYKYVSEQYEVFVKQRNSKLAMRYAWLKGYFEQHRHLHVVN